MSRLLPDVAAAPFVDGLAVQLHLLRTGLGDAVNVFTRIPDGLRELVPAVVIERTAGGSTHPEFASSFGMTYQVWHTSDDLAYELSRQVATVIWTAQRRQTATPAGHIAGWSEISGFHPVPDEGLPEFGRYVAVLDLLIRNPS
jgi:hypothetical protein